LVAAPDNARHYRPLGALARGHARLLVAARGKDGRFPSRAVKHGELVITARAVAAGVLHSGPQLQRGALWT
jgi:hypothetical protein